MRLVSTPISGFTLTWKEESKELHMYTTDQKMNNDDIKENQEPISKLINCLLLHQIWWDYFRNGWRNLEQSRCRCIRRYNLWWRCLWLDFLTSDLTVLLNIPRASALYFRWLENGMLWTREMHLVFGIYLIRKIKSLFVSWCALAFLVLDAVAAMNHITNLARLIWYFKYVDCIWPNWTITFYFWNILVSLQRKMMTLLTVYKPSLKRSTLVSCIT